jgi:hypothetical protein
MRHVALPPFAPVLLESMRAIGYETAAAVADLIDNAITAKAGRVQIRFDPGNPRALAIIDDGQGMSASELADAMRHGSRSPHDDRAQDDLGRFGLGLKTASMSQCRRLTVVTRKDGETSGMTWDLDEVARHEDWLAGVLDADDIEQVPFVAYLLGQASGTMVVWEKLDRLAAGDPGTGAVLSARMGEVADHLALVYHRYLQGRPPRLVIEINHLVLGSIDPFLEGGLASWSRGEPHHRWSSSRSAGLHPPAHLPADQIPDRGRRRGAGAAATAGVLRVSWTTADRLGYLVQVVPPGGAHQAYPREGRRPQRAGPPVEPRHQEVCRVASPADQGAPEKPSPDHGAAQSERTHLPGTGYWHRPRPPGLAPHPGPRWRPVRA